MNDFSQYQYIATEAQADYYAVDPDILLIVPPGGMVDTPQLARASADFQSAYARRLERKCATVVIMSNVLSQDAETRRVYRELAENGQFLVRRWWSITPYRARSPVFLSGFPNPAYR